MKDKDEAVCVGQCGKLFSCENDSMVACDRCSQFTCIECLGMPEEQYKLIGEIWSTVLCNNCRPIGNKEMKEGHTVEMQCKEFLLPHNERMIELETKINLKADKTVIDSLESNQHSMNTKMEGLAEDISKLNKKLELMYSEDEAKADRANNVVVRGVPEAADTKKTIKDILDHLWVDTEPEYTCITRMGAPRSDGSGRPIKVVLKNTEDRNALLRNKKSIRNMRVSESENFNPQKIVIMEDQTVLEREKDNKLRALLKEKRETESGFKWMIYRGRVKRYYPKETTRTGSRSQTKSYTKHKRNTRCNSSTEKSRKHSSGPSPGSRGCSVKKSDERTVNRPVNELSYSYTRRLHKNTDNCTV